MKVDLDAIESAATRAQPGDLLAVDRIRWDQHGWHLTTRRHPSGDTGLDAARADAWYLRTIDPTTGLAMVARIRELEEAFIRLSDGGTRGIWRRVSDLRALVEKGTTR